MQTLMESNGWQIEDAKLVVVRDGLKPLIGGDVFAALGISVCDNPDYRVQSCCEST